MTPTDWPSSEQEEPDWHQVAVASQRIGKMIAGRGSSFQMAVLADAVSVWLAGHMSEDDDAKRDMRETLLGVFVDMVRGLTPESEKEILKRYGVDSVAEAMAFGAGQPRRR